MRPFKILFIVLLVASVAGGAGYFAAVQYHGLRVVMQQRQDEKDAETRAKIEAREQRELAASEAQWRARAEADRKAGRAENPDQVMRGLTAEMEMDRTADGAMRYAYAAPTADGIYLQPFLLQRAAGVELYVTLSHLGGRPMGFHGIVLQTSSEDSFRIEAAVPVETYNREGGILEIFTQRADANTIRALREVAYGLSGKLLMSGANGSYDDRLLTAEEAMRIKDMMDLYDILSGGEQSGAQSGAAAGAAGAAPEPQPYGAVGQIERIGSTEGEVIPLD